MAFVAGATVQAFGFGRPFHKLHTCRPHLPFECRTGQEPHPPAADDQPGRDGEHRPDVALGGHAAQIAEGIDGPLTAAAAAIRRSVAFRAHKVECIPVGRPVAFTASVHGIETRPIRPKQWRRYVAEVRSAASCMKRSVVLGMHQ